MIIIHAGSDVFMLVLKLTDSLTCLCFFFFSSRRRHTRFDCDWSSDVCSSDLRHSWRISQHGSLGPHEPDCLSERVSTVRVSDRVCNCHRSLSSPSPVRWHNRWCSFASAMAQNPRVADGRKNWFSAPSTSLRTDERREEQGGLGPGGHASASPRHDPSMAKTHPWLFLSRFGRDGNRVLLRPADPV